MKSVPPAALADERVARARHAHNGWAAHTIHGGHNHALRRTLWPSQRDTDPARKTHPVQQP